MTPNPTAGSVLRSTESPVDRVFPSFQVSVTVLLEVALATTAEGVRRLPFPVDWKWFAEPVPSAGAHAATPSRRHAARTSRRQRARRPPAWTHAVIVSPQVVRQIEAGVRADANAGTTIDVIRSKPAARRRVAVIPPPRPLCAKPRAAWRRRSPCGAPCAESRTEASSAQCKGGAAGDVAIFTVSRGKERRSGDTTRTIACEVANATCDGRGRLERLLHAQALQRAF